MKYIIYPIVILLGMLLMISIGILFMIFNFRFPNKEDEENLFCKFSQFIFENTVIQPLEKIHVI